MKKIILLLLLASCLSSCNNELATKANEFKDLKAQAIAIHDEVMPKMNKLSELSNKITADSTLATSKQSTITKLRKADEAMMDWMHDYSAKFPYGEEAPTELDILIEKLPLLREELEEIKEVQKQTNTAIAEAEKLLAK